MLWGCFRKSHRNAKGVEASVLALGGIGSKTSSSDSPQTDGRGGCGGAQVDSPDGCINQQDGWVDLRDG